MESLSITPSDVSITATATASIAQLHNLINEIPEAQELITSLTSTLHYLERPLAPLDQIMISNEATLITTKENIKNAGVAEDFNQCGIACDEILDDLKKWKENDSTEKLSYKDWLSFNQANKEKLRTFSKQLELCETIMKLVITNTMLLAQLSEFKCEIALDNSARLQRWLLEQIALAEEQEKPEQRRKILQEVLTEMRARRWRRHDSQPGE